MKKHNLKEYRLIQFVQDGRTITYMPDYPVDDGMNVHARFFVKIKDKRSRFQRIFDFGRHRRYLSRHLIASQINAITAQ